MEENRQNNKLYMPSGISAEEEIIKGITKKEMKHLLYLIGFFAIICSILAIIFTFSIAVIVFIASIIFAYSLVAKNPATNYSLMKAMIGAYKFCTEQNLYLYKFTRKVVVSEDEKERKK